jgi:predicted DNA-binding transcriptional regulator YafY
MKVSRVYRLLQLIMLMRSGRDLGADALAGELEVSRRTLFRDLKMLELAGVPYAFDVRRGGYLIGDSFFLPPINLTLPESLALLLVLRKFVSRQVLPMYAEVTRAAAKIESALPPALVKHCGSLLDAVDVRWPALSEAGSVDSVFATLQEAVGVRRKVRIEYDSYFEGSQIDMVVHPYRVAFVNRGWYVIGYSEAHESVRTLKLDRVVSSRMLDEQFVPDEGFNLDGYFGNAWQIIPEGKVYHVELLFKPKVAGNVEEVLWHKTQQTHHLADDSMLFEVDVDGLGEITWWILGYGDQVVVQQPQELRRKVGRMARDMAAIYNGQA